MDPAVSTGTGSEATANERTVVDVLARAALERAHDLGICDADTRASLLKIHEKSAVFRLCSTRANRSQVIAKRARQGHLAYERRIYQEVLPVIGERVLGYLGWAEEDGDYAWLFIEDARGPAYDPDSRPHRLAAGAWLAGLHMGALRVEPVAGARNLDSEHYRRKVRSILAALTPQVDAPELSSPDRAAIVHALYACETLDQHWEALAQRFALLPTTLFHGDFSPKNVRVRGEGQSLAVLVFDWDMSGWGFPGVDLARFAVDQRLDALAAYREGGRALGHHTPPDDIWEAATLGLVLRLTDSLGWFTGSLDWDYFKSASEIELYKLLAPASECLCGALEQLGHGTGRAVDAPLPALDRRSRKKARAFL